MSSVIVLLAIGVFVLAYFTYGRALARWWGVDDSQVTPSHQLNDGTDYVPTALPVLFGHHFASIAGAAPIIGPIVAGVFGWVPVLLWIIFAGIFIGMVHDFGALLASVCHNGKDLSKVIQSNIGMTSFRIFSLYIWLTSLLVIAAFVNVVSGSFAQMPAAASSSSLFILVAIIFGLMLNRLRLKLLPATVIALIMMLICLWLGNAFPLALNKSVWLYLILIYIATASVTPVWVLLQPRDYLNSFFLLALIILSVFGVVFASPEIKMPAFTSFVVNGDKYLFPYLFITVACGAISGYHAMFASATTSKQLFRQSDALPIAGGGMLVECVLAIIALLVAASFTSQEYSELKNPLTIFASGLGGILKVFGLPVDTVSAFITLTVSSFALTSLDSVARVARYIMQNMAEEMTVFDRLGLRQLMSNKYAASLFTVACGGALGMCDYSIIWPIFGCANQLIALFTFVTLWVWLKKNSRPYRMLIIPAIIMFAITMTGLYQMAVMSFNSAGNKRLTGANPAGDLMLSALALVLFIITLAFLNNLRRNRKKQ